MPNPKIITDGNGWRTQVIGSDGNSVSASEVHLVIKGGSDLASAVIKQPEGEDLVLENVEILSPDMAVIREAIFSAINALPGSTREDFLRNLRTPSGR